MQLQDVQLTAGIESMINATGRYFRILSGKERISVAASNGIASDIITGLGVDMLNSEGQGYDWLRLKSPIDQVITIVTSELPVTDSRLSGDVDVNGLLQVVNAGGSGWASSTQSVGTTPGVLVPFNADRLNVSIQCDVDIWIGADATVSAATGIKISAGNTLNAENTAALYCVSNASGTAKIMESVK